MSDEVKSEGNKYRFKLLMGRHSYNVGTDQNPKLIRFGMGDIIETDKELDKMHNSPGSTKFERLAFEGPDTDEYLAKLQAELDARKAKLAKAKEPEKVPEPSGGEAIAATTVIAPGDDEFTKMDMNQLRSIAKSNGIQLGNAKSRDEVLKVIRENMVEA